jgi:hypothetical protein
MIPRMRRLLRRLLDALVTVDDVIPDNVIKQAREQITYARARSSVESIAHSALGASENRFNQHRPDGVQ